jgi:hypothetical protein
MENKRGCNNCHHYKIGELKIWGDDVPSKCLLGKDKEFNLWWNENGKKKNSDELTNMLCFQETKLSELYSELSSILDELKIN